MTATVPSGAANMLAPLDDPRFEQQRVHHALVDLERGGVTVTRDHRTPEHILSWIDAEFGGTWSSEAWRSGICVARDASGPIGFAAYDPRGLRFAWLDAWRDRKDVGVFGPFGVVSRARKSPVGPLLLAMAMLSLRERGYMSALIPMVSGERLCGYYQREAGARVVEWCDPTRGGKRWRATVLASGSGSNFEAVVCGSRAGENPLPLDVAALISNRPDAYVLERAARLRIPSRVVAWDRRSAARSTYDEEVIAAVEETAPDLVLLLGWMHVLPGAFLDRFAASLNVHPAFLPLDQRRDDVTMPDGTVIPALRGGHAVDDALAARLAWTGATVHRVAVAVDAGDVLARAPLAIADGETSDALLARLHPLEHRVLATAIRRWSYELPGSLARPA